MIPVLGLQLHETAVDSGSGMQGPAGMTLLLDALWQTPVEDNDSGIVLLGPKECAPVDNSDSGVGLAFGVRQYTLYTLPAFGDNCFGITLAVLLFGALRC